MIVLSSLNLFSFLSNFILVSINIGRREKEENGRTSNSASKENR